MTPNKSPFDVYKCARPNILALQPYRCARDDYKDDGTNVLLDANENAYGPGLRLTNDGKLANGRPNGHINGHANLELNLSGLNRYPDPHQERLKQLLCSFRTTHIHTSKTLTPSNLFVGVGSDEAIDILIRCFCRPGHDRILTCPPTYGMYAVSAQVNDVEVVHEPLDAEHGFALRADAICQRLSDDPRIKLVYICSPGNPTGTLVDKESLRKLLEHKTWNGVVVLDEAYVDFAPDGSSLAEWVTEWPNLVVMQTMSKGFGLAGIRLGAVFASPEVARLLNNVKAPYNVSEVTSQLACRALVAPHLAVMAGNRATLVRQRERLVRELPHVKGVGRFRGGFNGNFVLVEMLDRPAGKPCNETALRVYEGLAEQRGVVVRFRGKEYGCEGCLRVTVGTEEEVTRFLKELKSILDEIYKGKIANNIGNESERETQANNVIS